MAKSNPTFEKRRRERSKKERREEKVRRKAERRAAAANDTSVEVEAVEDKNEEETPAQEFMEEQG